MAKGYFGSRSKLFRPANQAVMKSLHYAYVDRKRKSVILEDSGSPESMLLQDRKAYLTAVLSMV